MSLESGVKSELVKEMRKQMLGAVIFRHEDRHIFGVPDISCTWNGMTSWWEVKMANPTVKITRLQALTCQKLAKVGSACGIIIYQEMPHYSYIVDPFKLKEWTTANLDSRLRLKRPSMNPSSMSWFTGCPGFNHPLLTEYIKGVHTNAMG